MIPSRLWWPKCRFFNCHWSLSSPELSWYHHRVASSHYQTLFRNWEKSLIFLQFALKKAHFLDCRKVTQFKLERREWGPSRLWVSRNQYPWWSSSHLSILKDPIFRLFVEAPSSHLFEFFTLIRIVKRSHRADHRRRLSCQTGMDYYPSDRDCLRVSILRTGQSSPALLVACSTKCEFVPILFTLLTSRSSA